MFITLYCLSLCKLYKYICFSIYCFCQEKWEPNDLSDKYWCCRDCLPDDFDYESDFFCVERNPSVQLLKPFNVNMDNWHYGEKL